MPEHLHYDDDAIINATTHHEESDVNVRALLAFIVIFVVFAVFTHVVIWLFWRGLVKFEGSRAPQPLSAVAKPAADALPQQPRLQPFPTKDARNPSETLPPYNNTPVTDLIEMRKAEEEVLSNYGIVNQQQGTMRIPIEAAKQLALQRGVFKQVTPAANTTAAAPAAAPTTTAPAVSPAAPPSAATTPAAVPAPASAGADQ